MTVPYVAIGNGECKECSRLLDSCFNASEGLASEQFGLWLEHANSDQCERRTKK